MNQKILETNQRYFSMQWFAFPLFISVKDDKKQPNFYGCKYGELNNKENVLDLYNKQVSYNSLALCMGRSKIIGVDFDNQEYFEEARKLMPENVAIKSQSGNGGHLLFEENNIELPTKIHGFYDIQRSDRQLLFVPPSKVEGGGEYKFLVSPFEVRLQIIPKRFQEFMFYIHDKHSKFKGKKERYNDNSDIDISKLWPKHQKFCQLNDLTEKQMDRFKMKFNIAKHEMKDRSAKDFDLLCWGIRIHPRPIDIETLWLTVQDISKFAKRGRNYFETTYKSAFQKLYDDNRIL
jgi:hypothetical protein